MQLITADTAEYSHEPAPAGFYEGLWNPVDERSDARAYDELMENARAYIARLSAAAEAGLPGAHYYLGVIYAAGFAGRQDGLLAYCLFAIACLLGFQLAWRPRRIAAQDLTLPDIAHARELATRWMDSFHRRNNLDWEPSGTSIQIIYRETEE